MALPPNRRSMSNMPEGDPCARNDDEQSRLLVRPHVPLRLGHLALDLRSGRRSADIKTEWHVMSLAVLNEGRTSCRPSTRSSWTRPGARSASSSPPQSSTATEYIKPLYDAMGTKIHNEGNKDIDAGHQPSRWPRSACRPSSPPAGQSMSSTPSFAASHEAGISPGRPGRRNPGGRLQRHRVLRTGPHPHSPRRGRRRSCGTPP